MQVSAIGPAGQAAGRSRRWAKPCTSRFDSSATTGSRWGRSNRSAGQVLAVFPGLSFEWSRSSRGYFAEAEAGGIAISEEVRRILEAQPPHLWREGRRRWVRGPFQPRAERAGEVRRSDCGRRFRRRPSAARGARVPEWMGVPHRRRAARGAAGCLPSMSLAAHGPPDLETQLPPQGGGRERHGGGRRDRRGAGDGAILRAVAGADAASGRQSAGVGLPGLRPGLERGPADGHAGHRRQAEKEDAIAAMQFDRAARCATISTASGTAGWRPWPGCWTRPMRPGTGRIDRRSRPTRPAPPRAAEPMSRVHRLRSPGIRGCSRAPDEVTSAGSSDVLSGACHG